MVSISPDTQSYDFTHMWSFVDYRNEKAPKKCVVKGSIFDFLYSNPEYSKFLKIVEKASMEGQLNDPQANFTLFIPSNDLIKHIPEEYFDIMDDGTARQILKGSTLNRKIDKRLLQFSPVSYFMTINTCPQTRLYVTNISGITEIDNCVKVVKYDNILNNGIIHVVDNLIIPDQCL